MTTLTIRLVVLNLFFASVVLPVYLYLKTDLSELLWLYVPVLSTWGAIYMAEVEKPANTEQLERRV